MFPRRSCSIRFHDSVTNALHLNAPYYEIAVIRKFQNPTRPSGSGETKGKESSFNRFLKKKKKKKKHTRKDNTRGKLDLIYVLRDIRFPGNFSTVDEFYRKFESGNCREI